MYNLWKCYSLSHDIFLRNHAFVHMYEIVIADSTYLFLFSNSFVHDPEQKINLLAKKIILYLHDDTMIF